MCHPEDSSCCCRRSVYTKFKTAAASSAKKNSQQTRRTTQASLDQRNQLWKLQGLAMTSNFHQNPQLILMLQREETSKRRYSKKTVKLREFPEKDWQRVLQTTHSTPPRKTRNKNWSVSVSNARKAASKRRKKKKVYNNRMRTTSRRIFNRVCR